MHTRPLRMRRITWLVYRGSKTITFLESPTPICLFTMQLRWLTGSTVKIITVICENDARPALKTYEFLCMREITWFVKDTLNVFLQSFSSTSTYRIELQKLSIWSHLRPFSATCVLRMRRNGYLCSSGVNLDNAVRFPDPDLWLFVHELRVITVPVDYHW